jgi:hypothetical protein
LWPLKLWREAEYPEILLRPPAGLGRLIKAAGPARRRRTSSRLSEQMPGFIRVARPSGGGTNNSSFDGTCVNATYNTLTCVLTTAQSGDLLVLSTNSNGTKSISGTGTLGWARQASQIIAGNTVDVWTGYASGTLSSVSIAATTGELIGIIALHGANTGATRVEVRASMEACNMSKAARSASQPTAGFCVGCLE